MSILDSDGMQQDIVDVLEEWSIPNAIVTLVNLDKPAKDIRAFKMDSIEQTVDEDTVWSICSNSKVFTVVALSYLVSSGKLKWTDKICDLVPGLALKDEYANSMLTLEDVLSHQTGIPAYNDAWYPVDGKLKDIVPILNSLEPTCRPLRTFQYSNGGYCLAAHIVAIKSGQSFPDFVKEKILLPLGMVNTSYGHAREGSKVAKPYLAVRGSPPQEYGYGWHSAPDDSIGHGATGLLSSAKDMAAWMAYLLRLSNDTLRPDDPMIIDPDTFREIRRSRVLTDDTLLGFPSRAGESAYPESSPNTYALGLWRCQYRGFDMAYHAGSGVGAGSMVLTIPQLNLGVSVFTPVGSAAWKACPAIALRVIDDFIGAKPTDWRDRVRKAVSLENNAVASLPSHSALKNASAFHGRVFTHPAYGRIHLLAPDGSVKGKPKIIIDTLRDIKAAKAYGPVHAEKMDLIVIFETRQSEVTYYALYHIGEDRFRGQRHLILRTVQGVDLIDAASSAIFVAGSGGLLMDLSREGRLSMRYDFQNSSCDYDLPNEFIEV